MYPVAQHKVPTQAVDSSKNFKKMLSPKAIKDKQQNQKELGRKDN